MWAINAFLICVIHAIFSNVPTVASHRSAQAPPVTITSSITTAFESGRVEGVFVITRVGSLSAPLTVRLQITGSATNGTDYATIPAVVQIPTGSATVDVRVTPIDDPEAEADELVTIGLADLATNSETNNTRASLVVKDNDTLVQVANQSSGTEAASQPVVFRFTRTGNVRATITVNFSVNSTITGDGSVRVPSGDGSVRPLSPTATAGIDFNPPSNSLIFQVGETVKTLSITPIDDSSAEPREVINIVILPSPLYTVGPDSSAVGSIEDNDTVVQLFAQNALATEAGRVPASFRFTRAGDVNVPLTVSYRVDPVAPNVRTFGDGTSNTFVSGSDFNSLPGAITFQPGEDIKLLEVVPIDDTIVEPLESFSLTLLSSSSYRLGFSTVATASIADNDQVQVAGGVTAVNIQATIADADEDGPANGEVTITRTGSTDSALTVLLNINGPGSGGNLATNGVDIDQLAAQLVIPAGATSATITVRPISDDLPEPQERIVFQLISSPNYSIQGQGQATVRIRDSNRRPRP